MPEQRQRVVTFGEIMGRLEPEGLLRLRQALPGRLTMTFAGTEANVAASLAMLGVEASFVTALPKHAVADALVDRLRGLGIDTGDVLRRDEGRLGLFYVESGANQRPSVVVYDRDGATVAITPPQAYDWDRILDGASWFHITGVTPSISRNAADVALAAVRAARARGLRVSCDLNFRAKLWRWDPPTRSARAGGPRDARDPRVGRHGRRQRGGRGRRAGHPRKGHRRRLGAPGSRALRRGGRDDHQADSLDQARGLYAAREPLGFVEPLGRDALRR